jgi:LmbE family N-acetylglucosaminyl deacetylase
MKTQPDVRGSAALLLKGRTSVPIETDAPRSAAGLRKPPASNARVAISICSIGGTNCSNWGCDMTRSVLAIGSHPDDIELGCAGALLAHKAAGDRVTILVMTGGENGPGTLQEIIGRRFEQEAAAKLLGAELRWGGLFDCEVGANSRTVGLIEDALVEVGADVVYVHAPDDTHQDHRAICAATLSAARRSCRVLHYQSPSTLTFAPTVYVDISAHLAGKLAALACHRSQVEQSAAVEPDVVAAQARYWGAQARITYAEAFSPTRLVWDLAHGAPVSDLLATDVSAEIKPNASAAVPRAHTHPLVTIAA